MLRYVHRNRGTIRDGEPRTITSTFTHLLSFDRSKRVTVLFIGRFDYPLSRCLVVIWYMPREIAAISRLLCVHHTTMHQVTMSVHSKPHALLACVFSCNLPPALLAE